MENKWLSKKINIVFAFLIPTTLSSLIWFELILTFIDGKGRSATKKEVHLPNCLFLALSINLFVGGPLT
jgi:hypothetical protein